MFYCCDYSGYSDVQSKEVSLWEFLRETKSILEQKLTARAAGHNTHFLFLKLSSHFDITSHAFHEKEECVLLLGMKQAQTIPSQELWWPLAPVVKAQMLPFLSLSYRHSEGYEVFLSKV